MSETNEFGRVTPEDLIEQMQEAAQEEKEEE